MLFSPDLPGSVFDSFLPFAHVSYAFYFVKYLRPTPLGLIISFAENLGRSNYAGCCFCLLFVFQSLNWKLSFCLSAEGLCSLAWVGGFGLIPVGHPPCHLPWATLCQFLKSSFQGLGARLNSHPDPVWEPACGYEFSGRLPLSQTRTQAKCRKFSYVLCL